MRSNIITLPVTQQADAQPKTLTHSKSAIIVDVDAANAEAAIYQAQLISRIKTPISVFQSSAIFMQLTPSWWQSAKHKEIVRRVVFGLAGQENLNGCYFIPELPKKNYRNRSNQIITIVEGGSVND